MSEIGSLSRLRKGWALARDEDGARWEVVAPGGDEWYILGAGETIDLAIDDAEAYVAKEEAEHEAWLAERARLRDEGCSSYIPAIWMTEIVKAASSPSSILKTKSEPQA